MLQVFFACYQIHVRAIVFTVSRGLRMKKVFAAALRWSAVGAMPPTGLCAGCTDEEYTAVIAFMAAPAN